LMRDRLKPVRDLQPLAGLTRRVWPRAVISFLMRADPILMA
jgi:hypothetical protein